MNFYSLEVFRLAVYIFVPAAERIFVQKQSGPAGLWDSFQFRESKILNLPSSSRTERTTPYVVWPAHSTAALWFPLSIFLAGRPHFWSYSFCNDKSKKLLFGACWGQISDIIFYRLLIFPCSLFLQKVLYTCKAFIWYSTTDICQELYYLLY